MEFTNMGSMIAWARTIAKMSQPDLHRATGIPRSTIAQIETSHMWARPAQIKLIAEATGCDLDVKYFCKKRE